MKKTLYQSKKYKNNEANQNTYYEEAGRTKLSERTKIRVMLLNGFSIGSGYNLSRDRGYFNYIQNKTEDDLLKFCSEYLQDKPIPFCPSFGRENLKMFREAEKAGIIKVSIEKADTCIPERFKDIDF